MYSNTYQFSPSPCLTHALIQTHTHIYTYSNAGLFLWTLILISPFKSKYPQSSLCSDTHKHTPTYAYIYNRGVIKQLIKASSPPQLGVSTEWHFRAACLSSLNRIRQNWTSLQGEGSGAMTPDLWGRECTGGSDCMSVTLIQPGWGIARSLATKCFHILLICLWNGVSVDCGRMRSSNMDTAYSCRSSAAHLVLVRGLTVLFPGNDRLMFDLKSETKDLCLGKEWLLEPALQPNVSARKKAKLS